jgi:anthranilate synthase/aminodeoxychorismate synthase-like glutamine amidotransferase
LKIVLIDNFDSFTYNLVHYIEEITGFVPDVIRNDVKDLDSLAIYDCFVLSPGPGLPKDAGNLMRIIEFYISSKPFLGVCLGHQALAEYFGCKLKNLSNVYHGESHIITINEKCNLYANLPSKINVGRYHSWTVQEENFSPDLIITGKDEQNEIMSFEHSTLPVVGIQYHPESILTPNGKTILLNFFKLLTH